MMPDIATTAAERTEAAQRLIDQAQGASYVELVTLSALELCVLGGPRHALAELAVTEAWLELKDRRREKIIKQVTDGMVERGLLLPEPDRELGGASYALNPALGIVLAARTRPAFIVITEAGVAALRTPRFLALGDEQVPVRAVVVEEPAALPAGARDDFPNIAKLGPLGRFYRYLLVSRARAAELLAEWAIAPPPAAAGPESARGVSRFQAGGGPGVQLGVRGDGSTAHLVRPPEDGPGDAYDRAGLAAVMLDLLTGPGS
jgi:hypothetical protein